MISDADFETIVREGIRLWNKRRFFECHDKLEEAWRAVKQEKKREPAADPRRDLVHGLILYAAGYVHWERGNAVGARRKFDEARAMWNPYRGTVAGLDVDGARGRIEADADRVRRDGKAAYRPESAPKL